MNTHYRLAVNLEWTSKCNAKCIMCPRHMVNPKVMSQATFDQALSRITTKDAFRAVIAGYGEPTTHPKFEGFIEQIRQHPVGFDMVTNGELLDEKRLKKLDGALGLLIISFSSINPQIYRDVHVNLDHQRVMENIRFAAKTLKQTTLAISLTPLAECLETLPETIAWLQNQGINTLTMSPTLYNRSGTMQDHELATQRLRKTIQTYGLLSQELHFIPSIRESLMQRFKNKFNCTARNSDMLISAEGDYMYCYNDIGHRQKLANVKDVSLRDAIVQRESMDACPDICGHCNMLNRYNFTESLAVGATYLKNQFIEACHK